jgi:putative ABC transport system permease protein
MKELFGLPTSTLAIALAALFAVAMLTVLGVFLSNRMMFKMGLRNIPRRGAQTVLVVVGLMLSTLIVTASFTTGDTVDYSISKQTYDLYGRSDLNVAVGATSETDAFGVPQVQPYVSASLAGALTTHFQGDPDVAGVLPSLVEQVAVRDDTTGRAEPAVVLNGIDTATLDKLGGLRLTSGGAADLAGLADNEALLSQRAAKRLGAKAGDTLTFFVNGQERQITVVGVVENSLASGVRGFGDPEVLPGIAMPLQAVQNLTAHAGQINMLTLALRGSTTNSYKLSDIVAPRVQVFLDSPTAAGIVGGAPLTVEKSKQNAVEDAQKTANVFTTLFLVLGLFSVAAGIMLIFLIFVMLAGER